MNKNTVLIRTSHQELKAMIPMGRILDFYANGSIVKNQSWLVVVDPLELNFDNFVVFLNVGDRLYVQAT